MLVLVLVHLHLSLEIVCGDVYVCLAHRCVANQTFGYAYYYHRYHVEAANEAAMILTHVDCLMVNYWHAYLAPGCVFPSGVHLVRNLHATSVIWILNDFVGYVQPFAVNDGVAVVIVKLNDSDSGVNDSNREENVMCDDTLSLELVIVTSVRAMTVEMDSTVVMVEMVVRCLAVA